MMFLRLVIGGALACVACGGAGSTSTDLFGAGDGGGRDGSSTGGGGDGGSGGNAQSIACGTTTCEIPRDSCCVYDTMPPSYQCVTGAACPSMNGGGAGVSLQCSGAANCAAGTVCCVSRSSTGVAATCKVVCTGSEAQLCDPNAASSGCSANAGACSTNNIGDWGLPKGYATCGGVGN